MPAKADDSEPNRVLQFPIVFNNAVHRYFQWEGGYSKMTLSGDTEPEYIYGGKITQ